MTGIIAPLYVTGIAGAGVPELSDFTLDSESITAVFQLKETGGVYGDDGDGFTHAGDWITPQFGMAGFEARATLVGGSCGIGGSSPLGVWLNLGTERHWQCKTPFGPDPPQFCDLTVEIRPVGGVTVTSANVHLSAM